MSVTGLSAIALRQKGFGGLYASHPIPAGQYGDGGQYIIGAATQDLGALHGIHMGALQLGSAVAGEGNEGMGLFGIALLGGLALVAYKEITKGPKLKAARNNPRRRSASMKQKRSQSKAAKAMRLYHSGKAPSLKAAWRMV